MAKKPPKTHNHNRSKGGKRLNTFNNSEGCPNLQIQGQSLKLQWFPLLLLPSNHSKKWLGSLDGQQWGLGFDVLGERGSKGTLGERMRRLNRLQVPNLGFSSYILDSPSFLGQLAESVTYSSTRIPLGLAEFLLGLAESPLKVRVFFPFLAFKTLGVTTLPHLN